MKTKFYLIVLITLVLFGCAQAPEVPPTQLPTDTIILPSITPEQIITPLQFTYVALGDSIPGCWDVGLDCYPIFFADYLSQDLGLEVNLKNLAINGDRTAHLLDHLQNDPEIKQAVADANVITIWIGVNDLPTSQMLYMNNMCGGDDNLDCVRERIGEMNENIDKILDEILALNTSEETRVMIADNGIPQSFVEDWKEHDCFDVLQKEIYGSLQEHLIDAASKRGVIVVYTYKVINGPLGDQENAGLYVEDRLHFNKEGHQLIADLHREAWE